MLDKLSIQVGQPDLAHLQFIDDTVQDVAGGWTINGGGDFDASLSVGFFLELQHHSDTQMYKFDLPTTCPLNATITIFLVNAFQANQSNFLGESDNQPMGAAMDSFRDGIYVLKYTPYGTTTGTQLKTFQTIVLILGQTSLQKAQILLKWFDMPYNEVREEIKNQLARLDITIKALEALVLTNNYTKAVKAFNEVQNIISEVKDLR